MSNLARMTITIKGTAPLLWHHFGLDALPLERQPKASGVAGNSPDEWKKTVLQTEQNQLYLMPTYIYAMLVHAAKHTTKGRGSLQPYLAATLQCTDEKVLVDRYLPDDINTLVNKYDEPVYLDVRSVRNPGTKGRNIRYRVAASPGWKLTFNIIFDSSIVSVNQMKSILRDAGTLVGLADARGIGFGRFELEKTEVVDLNAKTQTA